MAIVLNGTTGITAPDISVTAQSTDITTTGDITAVDATLSGGVYLGGTGAANYLDDYEEGTWTPTLATNSGTACTSPNTLGRYIKIGKMVTVTGRIDNVDNTGTTSTSQLRVSGLPFNPTDQDYFGSCQADNVIFQGGRTSIVTRADSGSNVILFLQIGSNLGDTGTDNGDINSGVTDFSFSVTYETA